MAQLSALAARSRSGDLDEARSAVEARVYNDTVDTRIAHGAAHDPIWAVNHAISVLS